jgi:hypothetical protein
MRKRKKKRKIGLRRQSQTGSPNAKKPAAPLSRPGGLTR